MQAMKIVNKLALNLFIGMRTGVLEVIGKLIHSFYDDNRGPLRDLLTLFLGDDPLLSNEEPFGHCPVPLAIQSYSCPMETGNVHPYNLGMQQQTLLAYKML